MKKQAKVVRVETTTFDPKDDKTDVFGDEYDVMGQGFKVHSPDMKSASLNEDFIMSDLSDKERRFVRQGLKMTQHIRAFLDVNKFSKERVATYNGENFKRRHIEPDDIKRIEGTATKIIDRMLQDYKAMAILSRGKKARMINALIALISGGRRQPTEHGKLEKLAPSEQPPE